MKGAKGVHGFTHAEFEPEVGVVEIDPTTGEMPVVVVNSEQPHRSALAAVKAWREHLVLPLPLLALVDLAKENPLTAIGGSIAALLAATGSVAVINPSVFSPSIPVMIVVTETALPRPAITVTRSVTIPPTAAAGKTARAKIASKTPKPTVLPVPVRPSAPKPTPTMSESLRMTFRPEPSSATLEPIIEPSATAAPGPSTEVEADALPLEEQAPLDLCTAMDGCPTD